MNKTVTITEPYGIIYLITNIVNGKEYIGATTQTLAKRRSSHKSNMKYYYKWPLYSEMQIFGFDNFEFLPILSCFEKEALHEAERICIKQFGTLVPYGYNQSTGGAGGYTGISPSEAIRVKLSKAKSGKNHPMYGRKLSDETKAKLSVVRTGKKLPKEHKAKLSKAISKPVICVTTGVQYASIKDAEKYTGVNKGSISRCCNGKRKSAGKSSSGQKFVWRFVD